MKKTVFAVFIVVFLNLLYIRANQSNDYLEYHLQIAHAEKLIAENSFERALEVYEQVFNTYTFVFLRDYQVATQLAWHLGDSAKACEFLKYGMAGGWKMKYFKKNKFLKGLRKTKEFESIPKQYDSLHTAYTDGIKSDLRWEVRKMSWKDQSKALLAIFRFSEKAQQKYGANKFAPKNELRLQRLIEIIDSDGYPGEKVIGNEFWMWGIVARHNQISPAFCRKDTMYQHLKPILFSAIRRGELSPFHFAVINEWFITVESDRETKSYGYLVELGEHDLARSNQLRKEIGIRSVETHNRLIDIQEQTGMKFYIWPKGSSQLAPH